MASETKPAFALRGIVEGFFGPPWTHSARLSMVDFMSEAGYNSYIYAPKNDPFHRDKWREDYPAKEARRLAALIDRCNTRAVDFCWAVSPGLSIRYSSPAHFKTLLAKMLSVAHLGVKTFALFLDDIPDKIQYAADAKKYPDLATAHAGLANKLLAALVKSVPGARLWFCPTAYFGTEPQPYLITLGRELDPKIDVFWTGPQVVSPKITAAQARTLAKILGRKPLLWDNYPVNDYNRGTLNIGPLRGRDPRLGSLLAGYFSNPMNEAEASRIPLLTIADYLRNPAGYNPDKSFKTAISKTCGRAAIPPLRLIAAYCGATVLDGMPEPVSPALLDKIRSNRNSAKSLLSEMKKIENIWTDLKETISDKKLLRDLRPQAIRLERTALAVRLALEALAAPPEKRKTILAKLIPLARTLRARHRFISNAIAIQEFVFEIINELDPEAKIENWALNELFVKGIMN